MNDIWKDLIKYGCVYKPYFNDPYTNYTYYYSTSIDNNYIEKDNIIEVTLPGIGKDNINIKEDDDSILIKYKQNDTDKSLEIEKKSHYNIDKAEYIDGVLKLHKKENKEKVREVKIS